MKKILYSIFTVVTLISINLSAQAPALTYSMNYTSAGVNTDYGTALLNYNNDDIIVGSFFGNTGGTIGPSHHMVPLVTSGNLARVNKAGVQIWSNSYGGIIKQIVKDNLGNVYTIGDFNGNATTINGIPFGNQGSNNLSLNNIFISKISPNGTLIWGKAIGGLGNDYAGGIAIDASNNIYFTGHSTGSSVMQFEIGNAASTHSAGFSGFLESYVVKLNSSGLYLGKTIFRSTSNAKGTPICTDGINLYIATPFAGTNQTITPSNPSFTLSSNAASEDFALIKLRTNLNFVSAKVIGGTTNTDDYVKSISVRNGSLIIGGAISSSVSIVNMNGVLPSYTMITNANTLDGFISLNDTTSMACIWAKPIGGNTAQDVVNKVDFTSTGNVLVGGAFAGNSVNFNIGGVGTFTANSNGSSTDYFYASYNSTTGNCLWNYASSIAANQIDFCNDVISDANNAVWATGGVTHLSSGRDIMLNRHQCASNYSITTFQQNNGSLSFTLTPSLNNYAYAGCLNKNTNLNLIISPTTNLKITFYDMLGNAVNSSSLNLLASSNAALKGCSIFLTDTVTKCEKYFTYRFSQINSLPSLAVNTNSNLICNGQSATLTGNLLVSGFTYSWAPLNTTSSGSIIVSPSTTTTYTGSVYDGAGCVWEATRTITVNPAPSLTVTSTSSLICVGQSATLTVSGANTYNWNTGGTGTSEVISPTATANYSVVGTNSNGCQSTAVISQSVVVCSEIENTGLQNEMTVTIYPNPSANIFNIQIEKTAMVEIYNVLGSIVLSEKLHGGTHQLNLSYNQNGIYFLKANVEGKIKIVKIIKE